MARLKQLAIIGFVFGTGLNLYLYALNYKALYDNPDYQLPAWLQTVVLPFMEEEKYPVKSMMQAMTDFDNFGRRKARVKGLVVDVKRAPDGDTHITLADGVLRMVVEIDPLHPLPAPKLGQYILATGMVSYDEKPPCRAIELSHRWYEIHPLLEWVEIKPPGAIKAKKRHGFLLGKNSVKKEK